MKHFTRRSFTLFSTVMAGIGLSTRSEAQQNTAHAVAIDSLDGVQSWKLNDTGGLELALENGDITTLTTDLYQLVDGVIYINASALEGLELPTVASELSDKLMTMGTNALSSGGAAALSQTLVDGQTSDLAEESQSTETSETSDQSDVSDVSVSTRSTPTVLAEGETTAYEADMTGLDGPVAYGISGADADLFDIDTDTGVVTFKSAPDGDSPADADGDGNYEFFVTANDGQNVVGEPVVVTVTDSGTGTGSDTATGGDTGTDSEEASPTVLAEGETTAHEADTTGLNGPVVYGISGADADLFDIDADTGVVTFKSAPDGDSPADADGDGNYEFFVTANDGQNVVGEPVVVTVTDSGTGTGSDTATGGDTGTDSEEASPTVLAEGETTAHEADTTGLDGPIAYGISGADADLFDIDADTGVVTFKSAPDGDSPADADGDGNYEFFVTASDGQNVVGEPVVVTVTDSGTETGSNDAAPVFSSGATASAVEGERVVYDANASDSDGDPITYGISGTDADLFDIDTDTGVVAFKTAPDFENPSDTNGDNDYQFVVTASDGANSTDQAVTVTVNDKNEHVSTLVIEATTVVAENQTVAYDGYLSNSNSPLSYSISGADAALFEIDADTGAVTFKSLPDYEHPVDANGNNDYEFIIVASNSDTNVIQAVTVTVGDVNESSPVFIDNPSTLAVEGQNTAHFAKAFDVDGDAISYSISGTDAGLFDIDLDTGLVTFKTVPDFENPSDANGDNDYQFVVTASDGVNHTDQAVTVTVTDENESASTLVIEAATLVAENQPAAYDGYLSNSSSPLNYSISGVDADLFNIDADTGAVTFKSLPDHENPADTNGDNDYEFVVTASDDNHSIAQVVTVTVGDANEAAPVFVDNPSVFAAEGQKSAHFAEASDSDGDPITYSISGADADLFDIDTDTGVVNFKTAPDYEDPRDANGDGDYEFVVTASDGLYNSHEAVTVTVSNSNDGTPIFISGSSASVAEGQTTAYDANASDSDGDTISYSISGTDAGLFDIDTDTGVATFKTAPNFENPADANGDNDYQFVVTASDGTSNTDQSVTVTVRDANDNVPVFISGATASVAENQTTAYDADASDVDGDTLTYSISGIDADLFGIDAETGSVTFTTAPDSENPLDADGGNDYQFIVTVSDGNSSVDQAVTVTVGNSNDDVPVFSSGPTASTTEGQTEAYDADASDSDGDPIIYSISGVDADLFDIDADTGVVTFKAAPDFENPSDADSKNDYTFLVTASDGVHSSDEAVTVTVSNVNDNAPAFTSDATASVAENQTAAYDADASDADDDDLNYSISGVDADLFNIDVDSGVVNFKAAPNYENPSDADGDNDYEFVITVGDGITSIDQAVTITVNNSNDDAPNFTSGSSADADEGQLSAYDADATDNDGDSISFAISGADAGLFDIDAGTGVVSFKTVPDFEAPGDADGDNDYEFTVSASDGVHSVDEAVIVTVNDVNDNIPVFASGSTASAAENQVSAYDADASDVDVDTLTYSISGTDAALFAINAHTGMVSFTTAPDFENPGDADGNNDYEFIVTASDGTNDIDQAVTVTVTDASDNAPVFTSSASVTITEGQLAAYGAFAAYDADATDINNDNITYSISGADGALFNIDAATGVVTFKSAPDFENPGDDNGDNIYEFIVTASDIVDETSQRVSVAVTNYNDNTPFFISASAVSVDEDQTAAYSADARDPDGDTLNYSIKGADAALFDIDANTGVVNFKTAPDYENPGDANGDNDYEFIVTVSDGTTSVDQAVTVTLDNVNDYAPVFTSGSAASTTEGQLTAYDADATDGDGDNITYSISGADAALFDIEASTGVVSFKTAPDFETPADANGDNEYEFTVTASDGVLSSHGAVAVTVDNINDNAPAFTSSETASVLEYQFFAYNADAMDADGDTLSYSMSGTDAGLFNIDANTGAVSFKASPDYESPADANGDNEYEFTVTASDGVSSTDRAVTLTLTNVNDNAPIFTTGGSVTTDEGLVGPFDIVVSDADGDMLSYSISGTDAALFTIDTNSGAVTFKTAPDFENPSDANGDNEYEFMVTASDGVNTTVEAVTLTVNNVNDNAPTFTTGSTATVDESQTAAYDIGVADADDDTLSYSISGTDANLFNINVNTGVVNFKTAPDFENPSDADGNNVYEFMVAASDGITSIEQAVTVTVDNVNDNAPVFTSESSASVMEDELAAYDADATDADGDIITYSISYSIGGADAALFDIDASTGLVSFKTAPDFENPSDANGDNDYEFIVTASDGVNSTNENVTVIVNNKNDSAPVFTSSSTASVFEYQISAYNADAMDSDGDSMSYSISGTDAALFNINANTGSVSFKTSPDSENPSDANGDNDYEFIVTVSDGVHSTDEAVTVTVKNVNDNAPVFTSNGVASVIEDQTNAYDADATDGDGDSITYAINGTDAALFDIDENTGVVTFKTAPDFLAPSDANGDNGYIFIVTASDGTTSTNQFVTVSVTDSNIHGLGFVSNATAFVEEGEINAYDINVAGGEGNSVTYGISGTDAALFNLDATTGLVTFKTLSDFAAPADADSDNDYVFTVTANDGFVTINQSVTVSVQEEIEAPAIIDFDDFGGSQGVVIQGYTKDNLAGQSVSSAGDFNGDGFDDVIIGAPFGDMVISNGGMAYVIFGSATGFGTITGSGEKVVDLPSVKPGQGFAIGGADYWDQVGQSVSSAGDVNGDGFDDLIIGAPYDDGTGSNAGEAYVVFGTDGVVAGNDRNGNPTLNASGIYESVGFTIKGAVAGDNTGIRVSSAGDVNGDGFDDMMVSAWLGDGGGNSAGEVYVIFGKDENFGELDNSRRTINLADLDVEDGFVIQGDSTFDTLGSSVASAGDINGDGYDDLVIGAHGGDDGGGSAGEAYVLFGKAGGFGTMDATGRQVTDLTSFSATQGFIIQGDSFADFAGSSVSSAGDINGDGFDDLVIGASGGDDGGGDAGEVYVLFGGTAGFGTADSAGRQVLDLTNLTAVEGFIIQGDVAGDRVGTAVSSAGDVNGDGYGDLILGAPQHDGGGFDNGASYVLYGSANGFGAADATGRQILDLTSLAATQGFVIQGNEVGGQLGRSVSSAGDVDGDGYDDLLVGAPYGDQGGDDTGGAYLIFGGPFAKGDADRTIVGTAEANMLIGSDGNDSITGNGGADVVRGGAGDDTITIMGLDFTDIDGGAGYDKLSFTDIGEMLDFTSDLRVALPAKLNSIEMIDITGSGNNNIVVDKQMVLDTSNDTSESVTTLIVRGNVGDLLSVIDKGWVHGTDTVVDSVTYQSYSYESARLLIEQGVDVYNPYRPADVVEAGNIGVTQGFVIQGDNDDDWAGHSVSSAGDVNGDGFEDLIVGANKANQWGEAYVLFGGENGFGTTVTTDGIERQVVDLTNMSAAPGFYIKTGGTYKALGFSVSSAGDVNGDGIDDLIVGAPYGTSSASRAGEAYVVFGSANGFGTIDSTGREVVDLSNFNASQGFLIEGFQKDTQIGWSVSSAGDINGDGYDEIIVGMLDNTWSSNYVGAAFVVFGGESGFGSTDDLGRQVIHTTNLTSDEGFYLHGDAASDQFGKSVSSAGDLNRDGYDDLIIGAPGGDDGGSYAGESYIIWGGTGDFGVATTNSDDEEIRTLRVKSLDPNVGSVLQGNATGDYSGTSVSNAGDVNGDGYDDVIIGAYGADIGGLASGAAYIVFGSEEGVDPRVYLGSLYSHQGVTIRGDVSADVAGYSVSAAGDVNGDGYADVIIGAYGNDGGGTNSGGAYIIYGSADPIGDTITSSAGSTRQILDLTILNAAEGRIIYGAADNDNLGRSVSGAGDIDGDGYDDLIVGAPFGDDTGVNAGQAYVIYGGQYAKGDEDLAIVGTADADQLAGSDGNDIITGNGGADAIRGGAGDDEITIASTDFLDIDGGTGSDILSFTGSGQNLNLSASSGSGVPDSINSIETINLTGSGNNSLDIDRQTVLDTSDDKSGGVTTLTIRGNAGDSVSIDDTGWTKGDDSTIDSVVYESYTNGNARLLVESSVDVTLPASGSSTSPENLSSSFSSFVDLGSEGSTDLDQQVSSTATIDSLLTAMEPGLTGGMDSAGSEQSEADWDTPGSFEISTVAGLNPQFSSDDMTFG